MATGMTAGPRGTRPATVALAMAAAAAILGGSTARAATLYWDVNGAAAGAGNPADGNWSTTVANWQNTGLAGNSAGTGTTTNYVNASDAVFSAGSDAATATVSIGVPAGASVTVTANSILLEEGTVTINPVDTALTGGVNIVGAAPTITTNANTTLNINTRFTSGTAGGYTKLGTGTLTLSGANTTSAVTYNFNAGTTRITRGTTLGADAGTFGAVTLNVGTDGLGNAGTFDMNGRGETVTNVGLFGGSIIDSSAQPSTYGSTAPNGYIQASTNGKYDLRSGTISARLNGQLPIEKTTAGTVVLSGRNSYSGAATITDGRLVVTGILSASASTTGTTATTNTGITVNGGVLHVAGAGLDTNTFDDTGRVARVNVNAGGTLDPGTAADTVSGMFIRGTAASGLTLASGGTLEIDIAGAAAGSGYDQVRVSSPGNAAANNAPATAVSLAGTLSVDLLGGYAPANGDLFFIVTQALNAVNVDPMIVDPQLGPVAGTFAGLPQGGSFVADGVTFEISYVGDSVAGTFTGGDDVVLRAVVPEPTTLLALGAASALLAARRRRR